MGNKMAYDSCCVDYEPQIRGTLDLVMGGVTYSVIRALQPWFRTLRTAL